MAVPVFNSWTFIWTLLGFLLILAGTSIDSWTSTLDRYSNGVLIDEEGDAFQVISLARGTGASEDSLEQEFEWSFLRGAASYGTLYVDYRFESGYSYAFICPPDKNNFDNKTGGIPKHKANHLKSEGQRARALNEVGAGMIAMLLLTNTVSFIATLLTVLASTRASIGNNLAAARGWAIGAFITNVVTWALWLRAHQEYLNQKKNGCRFAAFPDLDVVLGDAFGLFIVGTFLYLVLFVNIARANRATTTTDANNNVVVTSAPSSRFMVFVAIAAFAVIFCGSIDNIWSRASSRTFEQTTQTSLDKRIGNFYGHINAITNHTAGGQSTVLYEEEFGVYTAIQRADIQLAYDNTPNRAVICPVSTDSDGAQFAIIQGGRVTLGFAITATILAFFAAWLQMGDNRHGFWLSVAALCCCAVCLIVWATTADYIIRDRCCSTNTCTLGDSYGLIAAGAGFLLIAIFYQAWVIQADVFVLPAHAYGMANQFETELQGV